MALTGPGGATADRSDHPAAANHNTLAKRTVIMLVKPSSLAANRALHGKGGAGSNSQFFLRSAGGELDIFIFRATTNHNYRTSGLGIGTGTYRWVAFTYDAGGAPAGHLYVGGLATAMAEAAAYSITTDGSGATSDDSGGNCRFGNLSASSNSFAGDWATCAEFPDVLTLAELESFRLNPRPMVNGKKAVIFTEEGFTGMGTQVDLSGGGNHGSVNLCTQAVHPPKSLWSRGLLMIQ